MLQKHVKKNKNGRVRAVFLLLSAIKTRSFFNAYRIAQPFGRRPIKFLESEDYAEFVKALGAQSKRLVHIHKKGSNSEQATLMSYRLARLFANWLNPNALSLLDKYGLEDGEE